MSRRPYPRSRDRRGRGLRSPLAPVGFPVRHTRAEAFDNIVLDAVEHLEERWAPELGQVRLIVEPVPPDEEPSADGDLVALSRVEPPATADEPGRIVLYRHPLEARGHDVEDLTDLVLDVLIHDLARLLGVTPDVIDPEGHQPDD